MRPIKYTTKGDTNYFHYPFHKLRKFLEWGKEHGDNGWILISQDSKFTTFKGFGTIGAPCKSLQTITVEHDPIFGEGKDNPELIVNPPKQKYKYETHPLFVWNPDKS